MANNKKIYSIEINGVSESSKSIDALYEKILNLQKAITSIKKVEIPISIGKDNKKFIDEIARIKKELTSLKETTKNIDLGSNEYEKASKKVSQLAQDFTNLDNSIKRKNLDKLNDVLKDATKESEKLSKNTDDIQRKFSRLQGVKLDQENLKQYGISLDDLRWKIQQLEKSISSMAIGSTQWKETNRELLNLKQTLAQVEQQMEAAVRAEDQLNTKLTLNINGMTLEFDDVNQAIGILEDKMYSLATAGKKDTEEFKNIADAASKLKIQVQAIDTQIDGLVGGGAGLSKALSISQGFTSIATGAQGIASLFGGGEDMTRTIATITSLMGVLQSIQSIKQQMAQGDAFGQMLIKWNLLLNQLFKPLSSFQNSLKNLKNSLENIKNQDKSGLFDNLTSSFSNVKDLINDIKKNSSNLGVNILPDDSNLTVLKKVRDEWAKLKEIEYTGALDSAEQARLTELEKYMEKIRELKNVLELVSKPTYTLSDAFKMLLNQIKEFTLKVKESGASLLKFSKTAQTTSAGFNLATISIKGATVAVKAFNAVLKATIILAIVQALMQLVDWLTKLGSKAIDAVKGNDKLVNSLDTAKSRIDSTSASIERFNNGIDKLKEMGTFSEIDAMGKKMEYLELQTKKAVNELQDFVITVGKAKSLGESSKEDDYTWFGIASSIKDIEDFKKAYQQLLKAVEAGKDEKFGKGFSSWWFTASDAKADLGEMQKKVIADIQNQINGIDLSKGRSELEKFFKTIDSEMYKTSLDNIENLFPEEEWAKVLKERLDALRNMYEQWDEMSTQQRINELNNLQTVNKQIRDNNTEAIGDDYKRQKQTLKNQQNDEIESAQGNRELILSIKKKYNRLELDLDKQHNEQLKSEREAEIEKQKSDAQALNNVLRQIRDNNLAAEEESLQKRLQIIENSRQDEIQSAKDAGIKVNELILSINLKYDKQIEKEKEDHLKFLNDLSKEYTRKEIELQNSIAKARLDNEGTQIDDKYQSDVLSSEGSYDFSAKYEKEIEEEKKYQEERLKLEIDYLNEKKRLEIESAKLQSEEDIYSEDTRYEDRLEELKSFYEDGQLSIDEYNNYVERETKLHSNTIQMIETDLNNKLTNIDTQYQNKSKETTSRYLTDLTNLYSNYTKKVSEKRQKANSNENKNIFGIPNYSKVKKDYESALSDIAKGKEDINNQISDLEDKLKNNEISFSDYKSARTVLEDLNEDLGDEENEIREELKNLAYNVFMAWKGLVDSMVGYINGFLSTINDTQMTLIENQIKEVEHQLELAEEAYEKAEEAAEAHKDKMNEIEDELSEARGSRRQFLIDTLAAQQAAYLEDVAAQQQAENEKTKLEEKQQALERKRQEQDKKQKIQQALINTYTAVSNALAVQPWFLGLALSAVALALGMKNVAAIQQTPIYENGGLLTGKSHKEGGIPAVNNGVQVAEVEGGEFITNRKTTKMNLPLLNYINNQKKTLNEEDLYEFFNSNTPRTKINNKMTRFANGGQLPTTTFDSSRRIEVIDRNADNAQYVVSVVDIINASNNLKKVQTLAGLPNE